MPFLLGIPKMFCSFGCLIPSPRFHMIKGFVFGGHMIPPPPLKLRNERGSRLVKCIAGARHIALPTSRLCAALRLFRAGKLSSLPAAANSNTASHRCRYRACGWQCAVRVRVLRPSGGDQVRALHERIGRRAGARLHRGPHHQHPAGRLHRRQVSRPPTHPLGCQSWKVAER